jgi:hypothetical protein
MHLKTIRPFAVPILSLAALIAGCSTYNSTHSATVSRSPKTPAPVASVAATSSPPSNPSGNVTGSCDVSLSSQLYGQNYLTASVVATNTGNVGTVVRIKVFWPLQGFSPVTKARTVRTTPGSTVRVQFHAPVTEQQVSDFQNVQLASTGDPCRYKASITGTY